MLWRDQYDIQAEADKAVEGAVAKVIQRIENEIDHAEGSCGCQHCAQYWTRLANEYLDWVEAVESDRGRTPRYQVIYENSEWRIRRTPLGAGGSRAFNATPFQLR